MAKKSRGNRSEIDMNAEVPQVPGRQPCPCGSGKRYKQCHGLARARGAAELATLPFESLPGEADWLAMREIVPAASAAQRTVDGVEVTVCTVLPLAMSAMRRADGGVLLGLQAHGGSGDPSRDLGAALRMALEGEPGTPVGTQVSEPGDPRLQDLLDLSHPYEVRLHDSYRFWTTVGASEEVALDAEALQRADDSMIPTERLTGVEGAYWCVMSGRTYLRWVMTGEEDATVNGLARLHARGESGVGEGTKYLGSFRSCGRLVPVWELTGGTQVDAVEEPASAFAERLRQAMADPAPLTAEERRARAGVVSRQLTLR